MSEVLAIGDCHGHLDRLEALLEQEDTKNKDCVVVQLGDLGHFGGSAGSPTGDFMAWQLASEGLVDFVLWGNHDRAVVDPRHAFGGYARPDVTVLHIMRTMEAEGRLLMAYEAHGWLLTHAGLHAQFKHQPVPDGLDKENARAIADWLNQRARETPGPLIDAVGRHRGGSSTFGGVLWRDISEKLYQGVPQVFGHSASRQHVVRGEQDKWFCIDIGGKGGYNHSEAECIAGIWLPEQRIVRYDARPLKGDT